MTPPRAGVIGWPVAQSLSPKLHTHWLKEAGIAGSYNALPAEPEDLAEAFSVLPHKGYVGWNITVPHKEAALALVNEADETARAIGAVNMVVVKNGKLYGSNTDAYGFVQNLKTSLGDLAPYKKCALVIGAGGAAKAIVYALKEEGFERILITNRTLERAQALGEALPWKQRENALSNVTLLVNTTTLGMLGEPPLELSLANLPATAAVCDIVYKPLMTPLLQEAQARGNTIVTGLGMLIHQAVPGFEAWFGATPKITPDLAEMLLA